MERSEVVDANSVHRLGVDLEDRSVTPVVVFAMDHIIEVDGLGVLASDGQELAEEFDGGGEPRVSWEQMDGGEVLSGVHIDDVDLVGEIGGDDGDEVSVDAVVVVESVGGEVQNSAIELVSVQLSTVQDGGNNI